MTADVNDKDDEDAAFFINIIICLRSVLFLCMCDIAHSLLFLCMYVLYCFYVCAFFIIVICMCSLLLLCMSILYYCYVCISGVQHRFFSCRHRLSDFILVHLCGTILAILNKVLMYFGMLDLSGSYWFYLVITALLVQLFCGVIKGSKVLYKSASHFQHCYCV